MECELSEDGVCVEKMGCVARLNEERCGVWWMDRAYSCSCGCVALSFTCDAGATGLLSLSCRRR